MLTSAVTAKTVLDQNGNTCQGKLLIIILFQYCNMFFWDFTGRCIRMPILFCKFTT